MNNPIRIIHFTLGSVDPDSLNGINRVIEGLAGTMNAAQLAEVSVITVRSKMRNQGREVFQREGFVVTACHSTTEALKLFAERCDKIDLVHLHNAWSFPNVRVGAWLAKRSIPFVLTPHAAFLPDRMTSKTWTKNLFHRYVQKKLLDQAAALIAVSRDEMASIAGFTSNPSIEFAQNGAQYIEWKAHRTAQKDNETVSVGYLGRISREKNIQSLIKATALLPADIQANLKVCVFGNHNNDYGRECQRLVQSLDVSHIVEFRGAVSAAEKWDALSALDAYIQPSLSEAASIALLEAIAVGLPIVATRTSGVSYWHGQPFLTMVEPLSSDLARGLEKIVRNRELLREHGLHARRFYEENFTRSVAAQRHLEVYKRCLAMDDSETV
jgi:glycosyltransferase involved in cell wall biosynthesis